MNGSSRVRSLSDLNQEEEVASSSAAKRAAVDNIEESSCNSSSSSSSSSSEKNQMSTEGAASFPSSTAVVVASSSAAGSSRGEEWAKEQFYKYSEISYKHSLDELHRKFHCEACFLTQRRCVCSKIKEIFSQSPSIKCHVSVFMHYKEWGRASNSGKILLVGSPTRSTHYIFGLKHDEERLFQKLSSTPSLVLFPKKGSMPIHDFQSWFGEHGGDVNICVVDGTWSQAETMEKVLPKSIPRVHVDLLSSHTPSLFLSRKQSTTKSKVCTIEAIAYALQSLGEDVAAVQPLISGLQHCVDAVLVQRGKQVAYDSELQEDLNAPRPDKDFTVPTIDRPSFCPKCGSNGTPKGFKNMGMRWSSAAALEENMRKYKSFLDEKESKAAMEEETRARGSSGTLDISSSNSNCSSSSSSIDIDHCINSSGGSNNSGSNSNSASSSCNISSISSSSNISNKISSSKEDNVGDKVEPIGEPEEDHVVSNHQHNSAANDQVKVNHTDPLYRFWRCWQCNDLFAIMVHE